MSLSLNWISPTPHTQQKKKCQLPLWNPKMLISIKPTSTLENYYKIDQTPHGLKLPCFHMKQEQ